MSVLFPDYIREGNVTQDVIPSVVNRPTTAALRPLTKIVGNESPPEAQDLVTKDTDKTDYGRGLRSGRLNNSKDEKIR
jgi:hypothetical protein